MKDSRRAIPAIIVTPEKALFFGRKFRKLAYSLKNLSPDMDSALLEGGMNIPSLDYISAGIFITILLVVMLVGISAFLTFIAINKGLLTSQFLGVLILLVLVVPFFYLIYFINYPKLQAQKRKARIDEKVVFAIREMMIKVGSGVPIFNAMLDVSNGDYGLVSDEFKIAVEEIQSGLSQEEALNRLSRRVPSQSLRRAIDIIVNAIKSGSDIHGTLSLINDMLIKKQQSDMRTYAAELTPMSLAYMLISVVLPSLGMSVFIILGSIAHFNVLYIIYIIPPFLLIFQVFFMGMVGSRRPAIGV
ncbi:MAG: type II secretion system F family protein [Candidatus Parvarchaeota archaeon]|jgi:pilus assembly protein TadC|nr:type II secretion system F family protein [Candidatus Parvarchaeota archaeon]